ncbi:hypothetical protein [Streptobacillus notomytis]|uniref:hypothetical protein n=1 Tax=Streptobacillus notomytis TaxID=1712031 RepID=UPI0015D672CA|nr:hypothetical protein [Streptobacillus notomytis]
MFSFFILVSPSVYSSTLKFAMFAMILIDVPNNSNNAIDFLNFNILIPLYFDINSLLCV